MRSRQQLKEEMELHLNNDIRLYAMNADELMDEELYKRALEAVSPKRREKAGRLRFEKDRRLSLAAGILTRFVFENHFGISWEEVKLSENEYGKPFFEGGESICHNLSHSGNMVICAAGPVPVGCDIEEIKESRTNVSEKFFAQSEKKFVRENGADGFFRIWTLKESYMKAVGMGLSLPMKDFSVCPAKNGEIIFSHDAGLNEEITIPPQAGGKYIFKEFSCFPGYKCACAAQTGGRDLKIEDEVCTVSACRVLDSFSEAEDSCI